MAGALPYLLPCLSIRQPYAWLIVNGWKDIENRDWASNFRGRLLIHAGKTYSRKAHAEYAEGMLEDHQIALPAFEEMQLGGIVGSATMVDCINESASRWFFGPHGFVLKDARVRPFVPLNGQLGIFKVRSSLLEDERQEVGHA